MSAHAHPFRHAHAADLSWQDSLEKVIAGLKAAPVAPLAPDAEELGFLFLGNALYHVADRILETLQQRTGVQRWAGVVANGVMSLEADYRLEPAVCAMVGIFPKGSARFFSAEDPLPQALSDMPTPWWTALVYGDSRRGDLPAQLDEVAGLVRSGFVFGGLTQGAKQHALPTFVGDRVLQDGTLAGVAFRDHVLLQVRMTQALKPLGGLHQITLAHDNVIVELDGKRALDVLDDEFFDHHPIPMPPHVSLLDLPAVLVDMGVYRTAHAAISRNNRQNMDHLADLDLVALEDIDPSGGNLCMTQEMQTDTRLRFCVPDAKAARADMARMLTELRNEITTQQLTIRGGIYVTDMTRPHAMFQEPGSELRMIREALGDFPLVGYCSEAEVHRNVRHTHAGLLTLFVG